MSNVFERASAIRMHGEPWQNAVQRASSQLRYEGQMGGGRTKATHLCHFNKKSGRCRLTKAGRETPEHKAQLRRRPASKGQLAARNRLAAAARSFKGKHPGKYGVAHGVRDALAHHDEHHAAAASPKRSRKGRGRGRGSRGRGSSGRARKSARGGGRTKPSTDCYFHKASGRCRLTKAGRETPEHQAQLKRHPAKKATRKQRAARDRFAAAAASTKGKKMTRSQRNAAVRRALARGRSKSKRGGSFDSYSSTSSTRSSDFTSVSDTTSYSMSGGSWSSTDSSSLW